VEEEEEGEFLAQTLWKVREVKEERDILAQKLRKVREK
jgi:hypothetical protein